MAEIEAARRPVAPTISAWNSQCHARRERYDAWAQVLGDYFLPWALDSRTIDGFRARVRQRSIGELRFLRCRSQPLAGSRTGAELSRTRGDFYNILYVASGSERLKIDGREQRLGPGQFMLWDSARPMSFEVLESLDKLTLMVPERTLRGVLPNAADYVGVALSGAGGLGDLFGAHLRTLDRAVWSLSDDEAAGLAAPTLELFAQTCLRVRGRPRTPPRALLMQRIMEYIRLHLTEPALTPARVAAAHRISTRYLHRLFAEQQLSVADWIRQQRLERCRRALANPALAHCSITDIALSWGFSDAGHFARLFRQRYRSSPSAFRRQPAAAPHNG